MLEKKSFPIALIYVPTKRAKTLDPDRVIHLAEEIMENGQTTPIRLRPDGDRYVLIECLHWLEALRALGEASVDAFIIRARLH